MSEKREYTLQLLQDQSGRTQSVRITQGAKAVTPPEPDPGHGEDPHDPDDGGWRPHDIVSPLNVVLHGVYKSGRSMTIVFPDDAEILVAGSDFTYSVDSSHMVPTLHVTRTKRGLSVGHSSIEDERTVDESGQHASDYQKRATITINVNGEVREVAVSLSLPPVK